MTTLQANGADPTVEYNSPYIIDDILSSMRSAFSMPLFILNAMCVALSGLFFIGDADGNTGYLYFLFFFILMSPFVYIAIPQISFKKAAIAVIFLSILVLNQTPLRSLILGAVCLILHLLLIQPDKSQLHIVRKIGRAVIISMILVSVIISFSPDLSIWSSEKFSGYSFRLRLSTAEASYLGFLLGSLFFFENNKFWKAVIILGIAASQSFFALFWMLFLYRPKLAIIIFMIYILYIINLTFFVGDEYFFFLDSGYARFIGIYLLKFMDFKQFLYGSGMGSGDLLLHWVFNYAANQKLSGFLFSLFYDVGIIGMTLFFLCLARTWKEAAAAAILLCNFPPFLPFIVFGLAIVRLRAVQVVDRPAP